MDTKSYLQRAAEKVGLRREYFIEKNLPISTSNVVAVVFFGDMRSTFILSSLLLHHYKNFRRGKYIVLISWPEYRDLFPYVDEFWSPSDEHLIKLLASGADNFANTSDHDVQLRRNLFEVLSEVISYKELKEYYDDGFTKKFWTDFKEVKRFLPAVAAPDMIRQDFKQILNRAGDKVIIYPAVRLRTWQQGKNMYIKGPLGPWKALVERLLKEDITPIIYQNQFTYDLSVEFADRCLYLVPTKIGEVLTAMNQIGCVLDLFSGISRMSLAARCPFVVVDERMRFIKQKEYEIDDLGSVGAFKNYVFSFSTLLLTGSPPEWDSSLFDATVVALKKLLTKSPNNGSILTKELYESVDYTTIREHKAKRLGTAFIKRKY